MEALARLLWVCLGGAVGTGARYVLSGWALRVLGGSFPYGTLAVNILGSFLLAALMHVALVTPAISPNTRLALTTGAMGGFTTFSTFSYETTRLLQDGAWLLAGTNVCAMLIGCLAASLLGFAAARWLVGS